MFTQMLKCASTIHLAQVLADQALDNFTIEIVLRAGGVRKAIFVTSALMIPVADIDINSVGFDQHNIDGDDISPVSF